MAAPMHISDILVALTQEGQESEPSNAIGYGLSLASAAKAHLTIQSASLRMFVEFAWISEFADGGVARENHRLDILAEAVADKARGDAVQYGVACTTETPHLGYPEIIATLAARSRLHDLTILDAEIHTVDLDRELIEAVLFYSGRPLIVVPPGRATFAGRRILIGWDGSAQAARAVNDALPFLRLSEAVELVSVVGEKDLSRSVAGAEFAPHLARHGVPVTVTVLPVARDHDVAATLRDHAALTGADMMVIGAFRHSRIREWLVGGVTQSLLKQCPAPLFITH
ncbi:universal stress protein [Methylobacterium sp. J-078]|uniref:universal stress protein n=1 Tax=Methylobacterium sp. J-078 TaxID=2836657 RepID=UPI003918C929